MNRSIRKICIDIEIPRSIYNLTTFPKGVNDTNCLFPMNLYERLCDYIYDREKKLWNNCFGMAVSDYPRFRVPIRQQLFDSQTTVFITVCGVILHPVPTVPPMYHCYDTYARNTFPKKKTFHIKSL